MHEYEGKINCGSSESAFHAMNYFVSSAYADFSNLITNIILHIHIDTYSIYNHKRTSHIIFQLRAKSFYYIHFWFDDSMLFIRINQGAHTHTSHFIFFPFRIDFSFALAWIQFALVNSVLSFTLCFPFSMGFSSDFIMFLIGIYNRNWMLFFVWKWLGCLV